MPLSLPTTSSKVAAASMSLISDEDIEMTFSDEGTLGCEESDTNALSTAPSTPPFSNAETEALFVNDDEPASSASAFYDPEVAALFPEELFASSPVPIYPPDVEKLFVDEDDLGAAPTLSAELSKAEPPKSPAAPQSLALPVQSAARATPQGLWLPISLPAPAAPQTLSLPTEPTAAVQGLILPTTAVPNAASQGALLPTDSAPQTSPGDFSLLTPSAPVPTPAPTAPLPAAAQPRAPSHAAARKARGRPRKPDSEKKPPTYYRCRFGCKNRLRNAENLRAHMWHTHQLFPADKITYKCGACSLRFGRMKEFNRHHMTRCWDVDRPLTRVPAPATTQERADTWALPEDGPVSRSLVFGQEDGADDGALVGFVDPAAMGPKGSDRSARVTVAPVFIDLTVEPIVIDLTDD